jgi:hypothetical protein
MRSGLYSMTETKTRVPPAGEEGMAAQTGAGELVRVSIFGSFRGTSFNFSSQHAFLIILKQSVTMLHKASLVHLMTFFFTNHLHGWLLLHNVVGII